MTRKEIEKNKKERILEAIKKHSGILKTSELYEECNLSYRDLDSFVKKGFLHRVKNGYYSLQDDNGPEELRVKTLFPDGVLCMESALYGYGYIKERPFAWKIAIDKNTSKSRFLLDVPVVVPYYTEDRVLAIGVGEVTINGVTMRAYDRDRLICDVLKYEHKMDRNDYKDALRGYINDPNKNIDHLMIYAKERKVLSKVQNTIGVWL